MPRQEDVPWFRLMAGIRDRRSRHLLVPPPPTPGAAVNARRHTYSALAIARRHPTLFLQLCPRRPAQK